MTALQVAIAPITAKAPDDVDTYRPLAENLLVTTEDVGRAL